MLVALRDRLAPVLEARGIDWEERDLDPEALGDPRVLKLTALSMVRAGSHLVGDGGRVQIALQTEAGRCGIRLETLGRWDGMSGATETTFRELRARVLMEGGSLDVMPSPDGCVASVWFSGVEAACGES